ncbi:MAG TPA: acyltransferase family protein [Rhizomicrobium sp.]|nr:acyltransferase family protein [Rhizomicrobium sp.]
MKTARFADNNFTILRLLLALLVVLGHFRLLAGVASPSWPFNYAATAVDCFFVVSGYLITNSFDQDPDLRRFYIKRFFRLYPLYIAVVAIQTIILGILAQGGFAASAGPLLRYFLANAVFANFLQHDIGGLTALHVPGLNPSLWTLKIEFGFYLILPALWWLVQRYGAKVLAAIFVFSALFYAIFKANGHYDIAKQLPGQLQFFVLGIAAYRYRGWFTVKPAGPLLAAAAAVLVTALLRWHPPVLNPLAVAAFVALAALTTPALRPVRDISYGVYLAHGPVIQLAILTGFYRGDGVGLGAVLAVVLALAFVAERLIEAPGIAWGRRLLRAASRVPVPVRSDAPLSVLVLNDFCYVQGGASKVAIDEAVSLARAGAQVTFLGAVGPPCEALNEPGLTVECLDQRELLDVTRHPGVALQGLWNARAYRRVRKILADMPPGQTIVHLHGYTKALTASPVRAARRLGIPLVCTLHDFYAACPNGAFFDYASLKPCPKVALSGACISARCDKRRYAHKLYRVVRGFVQLWVSRFPGLVQNYISLSERSISLLSRYLPRQARIFPLANMMDIARQPQVAAAQSGTLLYVGRLDAEKGVHLLAETAAKLGLAVTFVGDGPLRAEIEAIAGMTVTGWLPREEVHQWLGRARCLVFPSLWYETFGLVVDEAAARGVPAIVSDISAAAERVKDTVTGWVFRSGDADDLARCLILTRDDGRLQAVGDAAYRSFWRDASTEELHTRDLMRIYRQVMQG